MVNYSPTLDDTFSALADPTRRQILQTLSHGETNASTLARPFRISPPAVSKHLRVLERAGLLTRTRHGREHRFRLNAEPMREAREWMDFYAEFWSDRFDDLDKFLQKNPNPQQKDNK